MILYYNELLAKYLFQLFKCAIWMVLNKTFTPFKDIIFVSKTKQVDVVNFHYFTISFNGLLEHFDVNFQINVFDIGWIL